MEEAANPTMRIRMKYFTCGKPNAHQGESLNLVCIEADCPAKGLLCSICKAEAHDRHRVIPLRMFLEEVIKCRTKAEQTGLASVLLRLEDNKNSVLHSLQKVVQSLSETVRKSQQDILNYYAGVQKDLLAKIKTNLNLDRTVKKLLERNFESQQQANAEVLHIVSSLKVDTDCFHISLDLEALIEQAKRANAGFEANLTELTKHIESYLSITQWTFKPTSLKKTFHFSKEFKATEIEVSANCLEAKKAQTHSSRVVLCCEPLGAAHSRVTFKIKHIQSWVAIGIGILPRVKERGYCLESSSLGHGTYMISNNGMTWSTSEADQNSVKKGFTFNTNEVIHVEYQPENKKLIFKGSSNTVELKVNIPAAEDGSVFFCATLCSIGDAVEIIG